MTTEDAGAYWLRALPYVRLVGVLLVGVTTGVALPTGVAADPTGWEDHERRIAALEESDRFKTCWMLEMGAGRDPNVCRYLLSNPEEFRPPFNGSDVP